jgi:hypothetical protein
MPRGDLDHASLRIETISGCIDDRGFQQVCEHAIGCDRRDNSGPSRELYEEFYSVWSGIQTSLEIGNLFEMRPYRMNL